MVPVKIIVAGATLVAGAVSTIFVKKKHDSNEKEKRIQKEAEHAKAEAEKENEKRNYLDRIKSLVILDKENSINDIECFYKTVHYGNYRFPEEFDNTSYRNADECNNIDTIIELLDKYKDCFEKLRKCFQSTTELFLTDYRIEDDFKWEKLNDQQKVCFRDIVILSDSIVSLCSSKGDLFDEMYLTSEIEQSRNVIEQYLIDSSTE